MKQIRNISYQDRLWLCFTAGVIGGTVIANLLRGELQSEVGYFHTLFQSGQRLGRGEQYRLCLFVIRQRVLELLGAWMISMTVFSVVGYYVLAVLAGSSISVVMAVITMEKGLSGLPFYLATVMPQACFYVPVCLILASWGGDDSRKIHLLGTAVLLGLTIAGAFAEVYLSPVLQRVL